MPYLHQSVDRHVFRLLSKMFTPLAIVLMISLLACAKAASIVSSQ